MGAFCVSAAVSGAPHNGQAETGSLSTEEQEPNKSPRVLMDLNGFNNGHVSSPVCAVKPNG